jgi:hypothetical protein
MTEPIDPEAGRLILSQRINTLLAALDEEEPATAHQRRTPTGTDEDGRVPLDVLAEKLDLSEFEGDLLLLAAAAELHGPAAEALARWHGDVHQTNPTMAIAIQRFDDAHWSALAPGRPLRYYGLVELKSGASLTSRPIAIDERVLHHLLGIDYLDDRLAHILRHQRQAHPLPHQHATAAQRLSELIHLGDTIPQLVGLHRTDRLAVAASAAATIGHDCFVLDADDIPTSPADRDGFVRLWTREVLLSGGLLVIDVGPRTSADSERAAARLADQLPAAVISARESVDLLGPSVEVRVDPVGPTERAGLYAGVIDGEVPEVARVADQFALSVGQMLASAHEAAHRAGESSDLGEALWASARAQARPGLQLLAQRIVAVATWDDLVIPEQQKAQLEHLADQVAHRTTVYEDWGFRAKGGRGLGITALFSGPSGTGKTMAAEVLGNHLDLDVYRIDLSSVVSKYIGETEKNLRRVFDAAEAGGAILLFDEADALFGKRSEVKDSHDRYANIEVSYLLQRMEEYRGLAILTTNDSEAIDEAFVRRLRFIVRFPYPSVNARQRIWLQVWPDGMGDGLDHDLLARYELAGGNIRSVAVDAAFRAAAAGTQVTMDHVYDALKAESVKLGVPFGLAGVSG